MMQKLPNSLYLGHASCVFCSNKENAVGEGKVAGANYTTATIGLVHILKSKVLKQACSVISSAAYGS